MIKNVVINLASLAEKGKIILFNCFLLKLILNIELIVEEYKLVVYCNSIFINFKVLL